MATGDDDDFAQWVADEGGPEAVAAMVAEIRRRVADGSLQGFTDKDAFLSHLSHRDRRSA